MLFLGILIGGPPSAFLLWGFGKPLVSKHDREGIPAHRRIPVPKGFLAAVAHLAGTFVGFCFWAALFVIPLCLVLR